MKETPYQSILNEVARVAIENGRNPSEITVIAVSKGCEKSALIEPYNQGCRDYGESRLQEAFPKMDQMPSDIRWHLIGTLQSNKVKKAIGRFVLIHSVDNPELAEKISKHSEEVGVETNILLQVNTSGELSKHGLDVKGWREAFSKVKHLPSLRIVGLMTMAPLSEDAEKVRETFSRLRHFRDELEEMEKVSLPHLSMGMTQDYPIAIAEGATLLRIGTAIFKS